MSIFSKLFRKNKATVRMTAEEAFAPEVRPEPKPEPQPEPKPAEVRPVEAVPQQSAPVPEPPRVVITRNLRVYAACVNPDDVFNILRPLFVDKCATVAEDGDSCTATLANGVQAMFARSDEGFTARLTRRYGVLRNPDIANVMLQISMFNLCLNVRLTADSRDKLDAARPLVSAAAEALNGFIEWDESALHTYDGRLLMNISGETELSGFAPQTPASEPTDPDLDRMTRSNEALAAHGINYDSGKPVQVRASEANLRGVNEIAERAACLFSCVLVASAYMSPKEIPAPAQFSEKAVSRLQEQYNIMSCLTPKEAQYIKNPRYHSTFMAKSESCAVMLWALGYIDLPWPDKLTDTGILGSVLKSSDMSRLMSCARPRSIEEVLDLQDLTFRLHSYCVMREDAQGISEDAVYERHYALNWLLGVNGVNNWDDVIPKT